MSGTYHQAAHDAFSPGVQKVLVKLHPELGVAKKAIAAIDAIVDKVLVQIVTRAVEAARRKKPTSLSPTASSLTGSGMLSSSPTSVSFLSPQREIHLSYVEMQEALSHIFPTELFTPANAAGSRVLSAYWAAGDDEERDDFTSGTRATEYEGFEVIPAPTVTRDSAHNVKRITSTGNLSAPRMQLDLAFSVELIHSRLLLEREFSRVHFDGTAHLYLSGVLEWLTSRVIEVTGRVSNEIGLGEIIEEHVQTGIFKDEALKHLIWGTPLIDRRKEEEAEAARRAHEAAVAKLLEEERTVTTARLAKLTAESSRGQEEDSPTREQPESVGSDTTETATTATVTTTTTITTVASELERPHTESVVSVPETATAEATIERNDEETKAETRELLPPMTTEASTLEKREEYNSAGVPEEFTSHVQPKQTMEETVVEGNSEKQTSEDNASLAAESTTTAPPAPIASTPTRSLLSLKAVLSVLALSILLYWLLSALSIIPSAVALKADASLSSPLALPLAANRTIAAPMNCRGWQAKEGQYDSLQPR